MWTSSATLTLDAADSVFVNAAIANKGSGGLELDAGGSVNIAAPVNLAGDVTINATSGSIVETGIGSIATAALTTNTASGAAFTGNNSVAAFQATNTISGGINLQDNSATLTVASVTETGGTSTSTTMAARIIVTGFVSDESGDVGLFTAGSLIENGGAIDSFILTTNAVGGTELNGANTVQFVRGANAVSGNLEFGDSTPTLVVIGMGESGGGALRISNTGSVSIVGPVSASTGNVALSASGTVTEDNNGRITAAGLELLGSMIILLRMAGSLRILPAIPRETSFTIMPAVF